MVARLDPIKDHTTVIRAFKLIQKVYPKAILHLLGDGNERHSLEALVASLKLTDMVRFHGDVADVPRFLQQWDLFLYATTEQEGLGGTMAEAMANGLPCLLVDLPMLREWAPDGSGVAWVPPNDPDAMAKKAIDLIRDPDTRKRMAIHSYTRIKKLHSPDAFVKRYLLIDQR